jgi:phosphoribosylamine--glycine ligase
VTVVVAAENYPAAPRTGDPIDGLTDEGDTVDAGEGTAYVLHAGTALDDDGVLVSAGGRVLSVVGTGPTLEQARHRAYAAVGRIELAGSHHRTDIARRAIDGEVSVPG